MSWSRSKRCSLSSWKRSLHILHKSVNEPVLTLIWIHVLAVLIRLLLRDVFQGSCLSFAVGDCVFLLWIWPGTCRDFLKGNREGCVLVHSRLHHYRPSSRLLLSLLLVLRRIHIMWMASPVRVQKTRLWAVRVLLVLLLIHKHSHIVAQPSLLVQLLSSSEKERIFSWSSHFKTIASTSFPFLLVLQDNRLAHVLVFLTIEELIGQKLTLMSCCLTAQL